MSGKRGPIGSLWPTSGLTPIKFMWSVTQTKLPAAHSSRRLPTALVKSSASQPISFIAYTGGAVRFGGEPRHSCRPPRGCQLTEAVATVPPPPRTLTLTLCVEWSHPLHVVCCTLNVANADAPRAMPYAARCRLHVVFCTARASRSRTARASVRPRAARYMNVRTPIRMLASANGEQRRRPKTVLQENAQLASLWGCLRSSELVLAGPRRSHLHHPGRSRRTPRVREERADAPFNFPIQSIPAAVWPQTSACPLPHGVTAGY